MCCRATTASATCVSENQTPVQQEQNYPQSSEPTKIPEAKNKFKCQNLNCLNTTIGQNADKARESFNNMMIPFIKNGIKVEYKIAPFPLN